VPAVPAVVAVMGTLKVVVLKTSTKCVPLIVGVELLPVIVTESPEVKLCTDDVVITVGAATVFPLMVREGPEVVTTVGLATVLPVILKVVSEVELCISGEKSMNLDPAEAEVS
jgi:hypothetical protein